MLKGKGKVWKASSSTKRGHVIYIPSCIVIDHAYPFKPREEVQIELKPKEKCLIVRKVENDEDKCEFYGKADLINRKGVKCEKCPVQEQCFFETRERILEEAARKNV